MGSINVKNLLFVSSADKAYSRSFLFHCAKYWADKGKKVLYITHEPLTNLPYPIGAPRSDDNVQNFGLVQFLYLPTWKELLQHCYSLLLQLKPALIIIVQELETYFSDTANSDRASVVCASLLNAASVCANKNSQTAYLVCGYNSRVSTIPGTVVRHFFHNVWEIICHNEETEEDNNIKKHLKLVKLSQTLKTGDLKVFAFKENREPSFLELDFALKVVIDGL